MNQKQLIKNIINKDFDNIFMISDIHLGVRNNSLEWLDNIKLYFNEFLIPILKKNMNSKSILFILGDVFDNRQSLDINIMNASLDIFDNLSNVIPIVILSGNHDIYKKINNDVNSLRILKTFPNITVIENPTIINSNSTRLVIIPWLGYHEIESELISDNNLDYAFMHTDIRGLTFDNGRIINGGIDIKSFTGNIIFSGHIHKRQESGKVIYLGAPYQLRRSDIGNKKGIYHLNLNNNKVNFIENNFSSSFLKIKIEDILNLNLNQVSNIFNNNYVDIIISNKYVNKFNIGKLLVVLENCKYKKIELIIDKSEESQININNEISKDISLKEQIEIELNSNYTNETLQTLVKLNNYYIELGNKELNAIE